MVRVIVHPFISRNDNWILPYHLAAYSEFCDRIVCVLDRSPQSEEICRRFPKCEVAHWKNSAERPDFDSEGMVCDEGQMRQWSFDLATRHGADYVVFGDTDEIPTPDIVRWLESKPDPSVELWLADWVNLYRDTAHAIGGNCPWSFQVPTNNKKGLVLRYRPGKTYTYRHGLQHVRMEPNPLHEGATVFDDTHKLGPVKLIHHKFADWERWQANPMSQTEKYRRVLDGAEIVDVPAEWIWPRERSVVGGMMGPAYA